MTIHDYKISAENNELQTLWELGEMKDSGLLDASWQEIADFMNRHYRVEESDYRTEAAYRKPYQYSKMFVGSVFRVKSESAAEDAEGLREEKIALMKERQRLRDERTQYNKYIRDESRFEQRLDEIERLIKLQADERYDFDLCPCEPGLGSGAEMLILLSDWHIGMEFDNEFGRYNSDIARERIQELMYAVSRAKLKHNCNKVNVAVLGDMISGAIHQTVQVANRENVIEQVMLASEMIADFLAMLCYAFDEVNYVSVAGNHSRIEANKEKAVKDDRLDDLISWYVKASLSKASNFKPRMIVDNTVCELGICGQLYYFAHGDHDEVSQAGISKLVFMLGEIPYAVCVGHKHTPLLTEINGVRVVQNGSLCGSGDNYTVERRLSGKASQSILICTEDGIECCYPVLLEH